MSPMERNVRLLIAYDGTEFHGWQRQPGQRTVQGELEAALSRTWRHPVELIGSGRTDAGVHALGQVANARTSSTLNVGKIRHAVVSRLPADIGVRAVQDVSPEFHATRHAVSKLYRYRLHNAAHRPVHHHAGRFTYHCWVPLDVSRMRAAATAFLGTHDFTALAASGCVRESMVRTVFRCDVTRCGDEIQVDIEGSGFLQHQVRNMVGTLVEVGRGRWEPEAVERILQSGDRRHAGPTLPAHGLCLQWVRYPAEVLRPAEASVPGP